METVTSGQELRAFSEGDIETWSTILKNHTQTRENQVFYIFAEGVAALDLRPDEIPSIEKVNQKLSTMTGWQGVLVDGLEDGQNFYKMLANKKFPIGNFIRDKKDLTYTPEPDIVHDLYGHMPFFVNSKYANFCERFGREAMEFIDRPEMLRQFERFFWFTIEFGLIKTREGNRVFGAGIASSTGECEYALSAVPEVLPFDIDRIRKQEFRIDQMQNRLFILENEDQLYESLEELVRRVNQEARGK
ncbi:MAG: hypothetical protein R2827_00260 [Bdellovibrionales bacterium]